MKTCRLLVACAAEILPSLSAILAAAGHRVRFATSGLELLKKARLRQPDLILIDSNLPDMDATTVCEILSRLPSTTTVPCLLLASRGDAFSEAVPFSAASGGRPAPPFSPEELILRVNEALCVAALPAAEVAAWDAA
jgi:DNA-binding response OmpR family regulator